MLPVTQISTPPVTAVNAHTPVCTVKTKGEFSPAILPQDIFRARWKSQGLIDSNGRITSKVPRDLPALSAARAGKLATWVEQKEVRIKSTLAELSWETEMKLKGVVSLMVSSPHHPIGEIAIIGSTVTALLQEHILAGLHSFEFLHDNDLAEKEIACGDIDIRFWVEGDLRKTDLKKYLKGLATHLSSTIPRALIVKKSAEILQKLYPEKYKNEIPEHQISNAVIGNTAFRKLHIQEEDQLFMATTLGDGESPPLDVITANKMKNISLFLKDDLRIVINSLFQSTPQGIYLCSQLGSTQAAVDFKMKRVHIAHLDKCDARAYFRYFIAQLKGDLVDEPKSVEPILFNALKGANENEIAKLLFQSAKNHLPHNDLSLLLLMVSSLCCAERMGAAWDFHKIASSVQELAALHPQKGEGKVLYEAIFNHKIPFSRIFAALQIAAFFHLFTQPPFKACLTESSFMPAMQWQFASGLTLVLPLDIEEALRLVGADTLYEAFLPKAICMKKEESQVFPYLDYLELPNLFDLSEALSASHPRIAIYCLLADRSLHLPKALDLLYSTNFKDLSLFEEYLALHKLFPSWNLKEVDSEEDWLLSLAGCGVLEIARIAYAKWREKPSLPLGIKLFDAFLKLDMGLTLSLRKQLIGMEEFTTERALCTLFDACRVAEDKDQRGFHRGELISQALPLVPFFEKGKTNKTTLTLLSWDQGEGSPFYFALLENGFSLPAEYSSLCQKELIKAYNKKDFERVAYIHALALANNIEVKAQQDCLLLERIIEGEISKKNFKGALTHIMELAKLQKLSDKTLEGLEKIVVKNKLEIYTLLDSVLVKEAYKLWNKHFRADIQMAETIYLALSSDEKDALIDLGLVILKGSKKKAPGDLCVLLEEEHPKKTELLLAMLNTACEISDKAGLKNAVQEESTKQLSQGKIDEAVEIWAGAKKKQIGVSDYFLALSSPKSPFFRKLLQRKLLSASEATLGVNALAAAGETDEIPLLLKDLPTIKDYPLKLTPLLETHNDPVTLAKAILTLPCALPKTLEQPLSQLIEKVDGEIGLELFELAEKKEISIFNRKILRKKTEGAIEAKRVDAIPMMLQLNDIDLFEKAACAGLLTHLNQNEREALLSFCIENSTSFFLKFTLLKQSKALKESKNEKLKLFLTTACQEHMLEEKFEIAGELLTLLQTFGFPIQIQNAKLALFVKKHPKFGPLLVSALPFDDAFPFLPVQERYNKLIEGEGRHAQHAANTAKDLMQEPEKAYQILEKFEIQDSSLWSEAVCKLSEKQTGKCWKLLKEKPHLFSEDIFEIVLINLCLAKEQILMEILTDKTTLEKSLSEKKLIKIVPQLFLACPEQEKLLQARVEWQPLLVKLQQALLLPVDLKIHSCLSRPLAEEVVAINYFCQLKNVQITPSKALFGKILTALFEKCKKAPLKEIENISQTLHQIVANQKNPALAEVDPFLILHLIARLPTECYLELAPHLLLCGLDTLNGKASQEIEKSCEIIFTNLSLLCDEKKQLEKIFKVLDHKMCPNLFGMHAHFEQMMSEMVCKGFELMNTESEYTLNFINDMLKRFKIYANQIVANTFYLDRILNESDRAIVNLLLKKQDKIATNIDLQFRTILYDAFQKSGLPEDKINKNIIKRSLILSTKIAVHLDNVDKDSLDPLLSIISEYNKDYVECLFLTYPNQIEEILFPFLRACVRSEKRYWIKKAKDIFSLVKNELKKNDQRASEIEDLLKAK